MNWQVVKDLVAYGREQEKLHDKNFRFTVTTNGVLLNDEIQEFVNKEMDNVVLSLDGRKEINDKMRPFRNGKGSYDLIVPKFQKLAESRNQEKYYIRGTFTRNNLDFSNDILHFADLGTGTGCIGLTLLAESPHWQGLLLDLCPHAAEVAATNARLLGVQNRAAVLRGDMKHPPLKAETLQLVVSNPPYIAEAERHLVMDEVLHNEPHSALFSENNGLLHLAAAINAAAHALQNGGWIFLEHGAEQAKAVYDLLAKSGIFKKIENKRDIAQLDRCTLARKGL